MVPNPFLRNRPAIYGIRNLLNNKIYVGKSLCPYRRCAQYLYDYKERRIGHLNDYLYNSIVKYGVENFELFPLEFCLKNDLPERELFWIRQLQSNNRRYGYNLRLDTSEGMVTSPETSLKISKNLKEQWAKGVRDAHSQKLKDKWESNPKRRKDQGELFSQIKTKWQYKISIGNSVEICLYKRLVELNLGSALSIFHRKNTHIAILKGYTIERQLKGTINV